MVFEMKTLVLAILYSIFLKWATGLFDYSGKGKPPMYGDYEAQRHWMEITYHLPVEEWYFETEKNELEYWGLDYPPLTGYHSLAMGWLAHRFNPAWVALNTSRGFESPEHKLFMRYTVLTSDLLTYLPAVVFHALNSHHPKDRTFISPDTYALLMYPGLILIDYGHFQYNGVSLGLALLAYETLGRGFDVLSCIFYCLSISYKQMLLYFALPFFFYHLGKCLQAGPVKGLKRLVKISLTVIITLALSWYPAAKNFEQLFQILYRIFPIYRGVFEDKVSNFWCLFNVFLKFRMHFSNREIAMYCAWVTLATSLPSCLALLSKPTKHKFNLSLIITSLAFFLFSYQVHEKSILIVALPVILIWRQDNFHSFWFLIVSSFSMFPLIVKDGLLIPFISLQTIFIVTSNGFYSVLNYDYITKNKPFMRTVYYIFCFTMSIWAVLLLSSLCLRPPKKYPDLFPLLISCYGALHFIYFFVYFNCRLFIVQPKKLV